MGRLKTNEEFLNDLNNKYGNEYIPLSPYIRNNIKIPFLHYDCCTIEYHTPRRILQGHGCKKCGNISSGCQREKSNNNFLEELKLLGLDDFKFNESYRGRTKKISCTHLKCGFTWKVSPASILLNRGCPKCSLNRIKSYNSLSFNEVMRRLPDNIKLLDHYQVGNLNKHYHLLCTTCGYGSNYEWCPNLLDVVDKGSGCPNCYLNHRKSKGESIILTILRDLGFIEGKDFIYGYVLSNRLHLDFYFPKGKIAIEYDGIQHYEPRDKFGGLPAFRKQVIRDNNKNDIVRELGIDLLRISYKYNTYNKIYGVLKPFIM